MPTIIGLETQQQTVREIQSLMKDISNTNHFLDNPNPTGEYQISFVGPEGKKIQTLFSCPNKDVIDQLLLQYKIDVAATVAQKAEAYRIALDDKEKAIFDL